MERFTSSHEHTRLQNPFRANDNRATASEFLDDAGGVNLRCGRPPPPEVDTEVSSFEGAERNPTRWLGTDRLKMPKPRG